MCWPLFIAAPPVNTRCVEGPIYSKPPPCVCTQNTLCSGLLIAQNTKHRRKHKYKTKTRSHNSQSPPVCKHKTCCAQELTHLEASFWHNFHEIYSSCTYILCIQRMFPLILQGISVYIALYLPSAYLNTFSHCSAQFSLLGLISILFVFIFFMSLQYSFSSMCACIPSSHC